MKFEFSGIETSQKELKKLDKEFAKLMQIKMGAHLDRVRKKAADLMIPNLAGTPNPYRARKIQPARTGKLTVRTAKERYLLNYDANESGYLGLGKIFFKKITPALTMRVKNLKIGGVRNKVFEGTIEPKVDSIPLTVSATGGFSGKVDRRMPKETKATIRARFLHELKGRRIFAPAHLAEEVFYKIQIKKALRYIYGRTL